MPRLKICTLKATIRHEISILSASLCDLCCQCTYVFSIKRSSHRKGRGICQLQTNAMGSSFFIFCWYQLSVPVSHCDMQVIKQVNDIFDNISSREFSDSYLLVIASSMLIPYILCSVLGSVRRTDVKLLKITTFSSANCETNSLEILKPVRRTACKACRNYQVQFAELIANKTEITRFSSAIFFSFVVNKYCSNRIQA